MKRTNFSNQVDRSTSDYELNSSVLTKFVGACSVNKNDLCIRIGCICLIISSSVSVSVFTYCHKKLIKRGGLPSFVSLLWKVANGLAIGFYNSPMVHWVAIGQSCQGCR